MRMAEVDVRQRLVAVKRELQRSMSANAVAVAKDNLTLALTAYPTAHAPYPTLNLTQASKEKKRLDALREKQRLEQKIGLEFNEKIKHVAAATAEEVQALSEQLNRFLEQSIQSGLLVCSSGTAWFALFKHMDQDGSCRISYPELRATVRDTLKCDKKELPEVKLQGLWKALDDDGSGFISAGEFGRFMRAGDSNNQAARTARSRKQLQRRLAQEKQEQQAHYDKLVGRDINVKLRRVKAMSSEEMNELSAFLNRRLHEVSRVRDWYKLFKEIDGDGSGRVNFGELASGLREMLQLPEAELPQLKLQAMWKRLDEDESGFITAGELLRFAKRGAAAAPGPEDSNWIKAATATRSRVKAGDELFKRAAARRSQEVKSAMLQEAERLEALLARTKAAAAGTGGGGSVSLPKIGASASLPRIGGASARYR